MRSKLQTAQTFLANLKKLQKMGLNKTIMRQLIDAGPEGGATAAAALVKGGTSGISQLNKIQKQINGVGTQVANFGSKNLGFDAAVTSATKSVSTLKKKDKALTKQQNKIGSKITKDAKKRLRSSIVKESKTAKSYASAKSAQHNGTIVYVENPWTGEYHEAKMKNVAKGEIHHKETKDKHSRRK
jgi:hypothetical protein